MPIRVDKNTGIVYTGRNIPCGGKGHRKGHISAVETQAGFYKIIEQNASHPNDSWYNDVKVCGDYAVFKWVQTTPSTGFYQQVSPWYIRYGYAVRTMIKLSKGVRRYEA